MAARLLGEWVDSFANLLRSMEPRFIPSVSSPEESGGHRPKGGGGGGLQMCRGAGLPGSEPVSSTPKHRQAPATPPYAIAESFDHNKKSLSQNGGMSELQDKWANSELSQAADNRISSKPADQPRAK